MTTITLWHNPRCSKSRAALRLLEDRGVGITVRRYLDDPPTEAEILSARAALGVDLIAMMRPKEAAFRDAGLTRDSTDDDLLAAMVRHPILIERPIAFHGDRAAMGRPPEQVLALLDP